MKRNIDHISTCDVRTPRRCSMMDVSSVRCGAICGGRLACPDHMEEFVEWVQLWMGQSTLFDVLGDGDFDAILDGSEWFKDTNTAVIEMRYATVSWLLELVWSVRSLEDLYVHERTIHPDTRRELQEIHIRGIVNYLGVNVTIGGILRDIRKRTREEVVQWRVDTIPLYMRFPDVDMLQRRGFPLYMRSPGDIDVVQGKGVHSSYFSPVYSALEWASCGGYSELTSLLLPDTDVVGGNRAIRLAARGGHTEVVRILLGDDRVDPASKGNSAIRWASERGHTEVVRLLLADSRVDPAVGYQSDYASCRTEDNAAIKLAAWHGHTGVVALLMTDNRVDSTSEDHFAFRTATANGHTDVAALLLGSVAETRPE